MTGPGFARSRRDLPDAELAARLAEGAGKILLGVGHGGLLGGHYLGDAGDRLADAWIDTVLRLRRPDDGLLSEEGHDSKARLRRDRVWIVDPLDGTSGYSLGTPDWAVHIGLAIDGEAAVGAVAIPTAGEVYRSDTVTAPTGPLTRRIAASRYASYEIGYVARVLGMEIVTMGSAGVKAMAVVRGDVDAYVVTSGQNEWDSCAPVAVAAAAGLHCSRLDGSPLRYNNRDTYLPDYVICRPEIATEVLAALEHI